MKSSCDFNKILHEKENIFSSKFFNMYFTQSLTMESRLGIVVSKKSLKKAVDRNKIKRFIREKFRKSPNKSLPVNIILVLFNKFSMQDRTEFTEHLKESLNFLHNLKIL